MTIKYSVEDIELFNQGEDDARARKPCQSDNEMYMNGYRYGQSKVIDWTIFEDNDERVNE